MTLFKINYSWSKSTISIFYKSIWRLEALAIKSYHFDSTLPLKHTLSFTFQNLKISQISPTISKPNSTSVLHQKSFKMRKTKSTFTFIPTDDIKRLNPLILHYLYMFALAISCSLFVFIIEINNFKYLLSLKYVFSDLIWIRVKMEEKGAF